MCSSFSEGESCRWPRAACHESRLRPTLVAWGKSLDPAPRAPAALRSPRSPLFRGRRRPRVEPTLGTPSIPPMARLLLSTLIEDASASDDATVSRVVRTLLRSPVTDAERVGERLCVYGWECSRPDSQMISWRYKVVGEDSGTEYVSFGLAMPTGPDLLLSVFGLQLQIALNGLGVDLRGRGRLLHGADGGGPRRIARSILRARPVVDVQPGGRMSGRHPSRGARQGCRSTLTCGPSRG